MAKGKTKKTVGPKEAALRNMREGNAESNTATIELPPEVLAGIEAEEKKLRDEFEASLKTKREGLTHIATLKAERANHQRAWNEADAKLREIDKELSKLTGSAPKAAATGGKRRRLKAEDKKQIATLLAGLLKQNPGKRYASKDLENAAEGVAVRELVAIWNADNKGDKISIEGNKASTRYFFGE